MSGKQSKKIRKAKSIPKKAIAGAAAAILCAAPVATEGGEVLLSLYPSFSFPVVKFDNSLSTGFGGGLRLTYKPSEYFKIFVQGDYKKYAFDTKQAIGDVSVIEGTLGAGYYLPLSDRVGLNFDAGIGYYNAKYKNPLDTSKKTTSIPGLSINGSISVSYKLNPVLSVSAGGAAEHLAYKNSKFITSLGVNPTFSVNLTKAFSNQTEVSVKQTSLKPVFPVFYSWYNDNTFGTVEVTNQEDASITDVEVFFYQPQYMGQPQSCGQQAVLKKGESFGVDLRAFFNEQMLSLNEKTDTLTNIIVEYKYLGSKRSATFPMIVPVYGRNNMSWEDDRCASAFVSSKDPAAMWFAKYVVSTVRDNVRSGLPLNMQYAMAVFEALDQFGINYVKDPTSAFEDNVGTASIDFLQFPYQTLMYRGGDCDDLSILVCSLFESIGIKTAFITIPGHIFMAFDSGFTVEQARGYFLTLDEFIVDGDKVWVPLEITLSDEGFNKAWHKGAWEWNTAYRNNAAMIYKMEDSWKVYKPVNVPGAAAKFTLPDETYVARLFSHSVDEFVLGQITPQIAWYENRIAMEPSAQNYNDFGVLYARYGLFEQAEKQFRIARNMDYLPAVLNTANLYYSIKDYTRATNWYNEVLAQDKENSLAMIGLARCAYENGNYKECDLWYGTVYQNDRKLARQYSYLGGFEQTTGRSFSLADRLENTVWLNSTDTAVRTNSSLTPQTQVAAATTTQVKVQEKTPVEESPVQDLAGNAVVAVVPATTPTEPKEDEEEQSTSAGPDPDTTSAVPEALEGPQEVATAVPEALEGPQNEGPLEGPLVDPLVVTEESLAIAQEVPALEEIPTAAEITPEEELDDTPYTGISSQLDFGLLSFEDLLALAEDSIIENGETIEDIELPQAPLSVLEDKFVMAEPEPTTAVPVLRQAQEPQNEGPKEVATAVPEALEGPKEVASAVPEALEGPKEVASVVPEALEGPLEESPVQTTAIAEAPAAVPEALEGPLEVALEGPKEVASVVPEALEGPLEVAVEGPKEVATAVPEALEGPLEVATAVPEALEGPLEVAVERPKEVASVVPEALEGPLEVASVVPEALEGPLAEETLETLETLETPETLETLAEKIAAAPVVEPTVEPEPQAPAQEALPSKPQTATTSIMTDVPVRAVPRFTEQPSEQWAPKEAYTAETIPGMRSFDEEMGSFQNDKAFLYKEEFSFSTNPGEEIEEKEDEEETILTTLEVNPFASFIPQEELAKMEEITNFKMDEPVAVSISTTVLEQESVVVSVPEASTALTEAPTPAVPEALEGPLEVATVVPEALEGPQSEDPKSEGPQEDPSVVPEALEGPQEESLLEQKTTKKSNKIIYIGLAALAGAIAALFSVLKKRGKKND